MPANCQFHIDDAEREFTYDTNSFDFVFARNIGQGITDWGEMMSEIYR
jgi:sugar phosphate isomerase/epimerase